MNFKPSLPTGRAKIFLGAVIIFFLVFLISLKTKSTNSPPDQITLEAKENKFHVTFNLPNQEVNFINFLEKLNLPQNTKNGFFFELDGTSSALLTNASPIKAELKTSEDRINFVGETSKDPTQKFFLVKNIKVPKSTNLVVAAASFKNFIKSKYSFSDQFRSWLDNNLDKDSGQYLIVFGKSADFAIVFQKENIDFESLKNIQVLGEPIYFEEITSDTNIHIIKLPLGEDQIQQTIVIFQKEDEFFLVSSYDAAKDLLEVQLGKQDHIKLPNIGENQQIALAVNFRNSNEYPASSNFAKLLFDSKPQLIDKLTKITNFELTLKSSKFSGLIIVR